MTTRRSHGDGGLHWDQTRQRWIATITTGYRLHPAGKRVVRKAAGHTKTEARTKLKDLIRDHDDGVAAAERGYTVAQAVTHRARGREAHTLTGLSTEIAHLRIALDTLATTVRRHEEQLRRLRRHDERADS